MTKGTAGYVSDAVDTTDSDGTCAAITEHAYDRVRFTAESHSLSVKYHVCCGVLVVHAWLQRHGHMITAWGAGYGPDDVNMSVKAASIQRITSFSGRKQKKVHH